MQRPARSRRRRRAKSGQHHGASSQRRPRSVGLTVLAGRDCGTLAIACLPSSIPKNGSPSRTSENCAASDQGRRMHHRLFDDRPDRHAIKGKVAEHRLGHSRHRQGQPCRALVPYVEQSVNWVRVAQRVFLFASILRARRNFWSGSAPALSSRSVAARECR